MPSRLLAISLVSVSFLLSAHSAWGVPVPFPYMTLTEVLNKYDSAVIARLEQATNPDQFRVTNVIKGDPSLEQTVINARARPTGVDSKSFLLVGSRKRSTLETRWQVAKPMTDACRQHMQSIIRMNKTGAERLAFFQPFLRHADNLVAENAHLEFVNATDESFAAACKRLDRAKLREWLDEPLAATKCRSTLR